MSKFSNLQDDLKQVEIISGYEIIDTPGEELFDDFTHLAAHICQAPISLISFLDGQRYWFKSKYGLDVDEAPKDFSFCTYALENPGEVLVVPNALEDSRFENSPMVRGEPFVRSYAGAPLMTANGNALGTLCVIDSKPRAFSTEQILALGRLARQVVAQLEARRNLLLLNQSAQLLERERREVQLILDYVPSYLFFKDTKNNILRVNRAVTDLLGVESTDIEGLPAGKYYPSHAEDFYQDDLEVIRSGKPKRGIVRQIDTADRDSLRWIRTDKFPLANEAGEIERLLVVATDITDLKKTEGSLLQSQALLGQLNDQLKERVQQKTAELVATQTRYEDLYQNAPDMYISIDPQSARILQCNRTLLSATGYTREEIIGQTVFKLYHPSSLDKARVAMQESRAEGEVRNRELTLARKDGTRIEVSLNVSAVRDEQGTIVTSRSVWRDITEHKHLEEEAKGYMDQLSHLSRIATMNELATGIAHELNQPLQAIKNYAQGAQLRIEKGSFDLADLGPLFKDIVFDADRAANLILTFRNFVKPSKRQATTIDPAELVGRLLRLIPRVMEKHGSNLKIVAAENLPMITCDTVQIKQVLLNLILNAAEAVDEAGSVNREIELFVEATSHRTLKFEVVDHGPGLVDAEVDRLFDSFFTTKETGLGVGLAICRTIVESHGGSLTAKENKGPGLTFSFELPTQTP